MVPLHLRRIVQCCIATTALSKGSQQFGTISHLLQSNGDVLRYLCLPLHAHVCLISATGYWTCLHDCALSLLQILHLVICAVAWHVALAAQLMQAKMTWKHEYRESLKIINVLQPLVNHSPAPANPASLQVHQQMQQWADQHETCLTY